MEVMDVGVTLRRLLLILVAHTNVAVVVVVVVSNVSLMRSGALVAGGDATEGDPCRHAFVRASAFGSRMARASY